MRRATSVLGLVFMAAAGLGLVGCGATPAPTQPATSPAVGSTEESQPQSDIERELAKLPEEDRKLAMAQKACPVSGGPLGAMGPPIKVTVNGRQLFICCEGCEEEAKKNFDKYLAQLAKPASAPN